MTTTQQIKLNWEEKAKAKYESMIAKIPVFHREIAKKVVDKQQDRIVMFLESAPPR